MIPKTIHYCWFGKNKLSDIAKKCIDSWRKFCPDYEVKEWNETNYNLNSCLFVREAYRVNIKVDKILKAHQIRGEK